MHPLETYLAELSQIRSLGEGTDETSYYPALSSLLAEVGKSLVPQVVPLSQLRNRGAGLPDYGLFTREQIPRKGDAPDMGVGILPARGVVEVKGAKDSAWFTAKGAQVSKYWDKYRLVLVTNYRDFVILGSDSASKPMELGRISLAPDESGFWKLAQHPHKAAEIQGSRFLEFIRRALLQGARLHEPESLAALLAAYAREARLRVEAKPDLPALAELRKSLEQSLGLTFEGEKGSHFFQSSLVQTLFYGLFSAWASWSESADPGARFRWKEAAWTLHVPMVRTLFEQLAQPSRLLPLGLIEVFDWTEDALNRVDRPTFFTKFNKEEAIQYFYEPFLEAFDPKLRKLLGVWYTPREIVRYMVARVDQLLRTELGLKEGLAHESVHILDPCCGTGAYLVEVAAALERALEADGAGALKGPKLKEAMLNRVHGFELLPAPFVVAHMQLGMKLHEVGATLKDDERLSVFLTNALTGWEPPTGLKKQIMMAELAEEKEAADKVKRETPILVILGNPPYSGYPGISKMEEERSLSGAYRMPKNPMLKKPEGQGLNDLYVRFFRMAEQKITEGTKKGIVCFISNYSWLNGLSHPAMREALLDRFDSIYVDNLHGDRIISEYAPDGQTSETIFAMKGHSPGIKVGTCITLLVRKPGSQNRSAKFKYRDFNEAKAAARRKAMLKSLDQDGSQPYKTVEPCLTLGLPLLDLTYTQEYLTWTPLPDLFPTYYPGVKTSRDDFLVDVDRERLEARIGHYFDNTLSHDALRAMHPEIMTNSARFDADAIRSQLLIRGISNGQVIPYTYRPFDMRWLYWEGDTKLLDEKRLDYFPQVFPQNPAFVVPQRARREWSPPLGTNQMVDLNAMDGGATTFTLFLREHQGQHGYSEPHPNISHGAFTRLKALKAEPTDLFYHAMALLHAPAYRTENGGALRQDWPRVPIPESKALLEASADLGRRLATLLDVEQDPEGIRQPPVASPLTKVGVFHVTKLPVRQPIDYTVSVGWGVRGKDGITMPGKGRRTGDQVWLNDRAYWSGISDEVWNYTLGGYQVLKKWLSYRETALLGRELKIDEIEYFTAMARRIATVLEMGIKLDDNYRNFLT